MGRSDRILECVEKLKHLPFIFKLREKFRFGDWLNYKMRLNCPVLTYQSVCLFVLSADDKNNSVIGSL